MHADELRARTQIHPTKSATDSDAESLVFQDRRRTRRGPLAPNLGEIDRIVTNVRNGKEQDITQENLCDIVSQLSSWIKYLESRA